MLVYTYPSKSFTARTSRFREHFDLDFGSNFDGEDGFGVNMLQTPSRSGIEVAALFLECLSLQDGGYADEGIVLEDEIGARIVEFERGCVLRYGGGGRGECDGNEIGEFCLLYGRRAGSSKLDGNGFHADTKCFARRRRRGTL